MLHAGWLLVVVLVTGWCGDHDVGWNEQIQMARVGVAREADTGNKRSLADMSGKSGTESALASSRARAAAYQKVWNTHDAAAVAAFYTQDADMVFGNLPAARGRQAIEAWWKAYFANLEPERRLTLDMTTRLLASQVGLVEVVTTTAGKRSNGEALPARRFRATWVIDRQTGDWLIAALRAFPTEDDRVVLNPSANPAEAVTHKSPQGSPALREFVAAYANAFNQHDPSAVSVFYTDDADIVVRNGPYTRGRQAIVAWWRSYFAQSRPYSAMFIIDSVRNMTPDVALIDLVVTGVQHAAPGQAQPDTPPASMPHNARYTRATWIVVREGRAWRIAALRVLPSEDDQVIRAD